MLDAAWLYGQVLPWHDEPITWLDYDEVRKFTDAEGYQTKKDHLDGGT